MVTPITKKQRQLLNELNTIAEITAVDYWNILDHEPEARTPILEVIKRELIRGEIVSQYTLIDDLLATKMCVHD